MFNFFVQTKDFLEDTGPLRLGGKIWIAISVGSGKKTFDFLEFGFKFLQIHAIIIA